MDALRNPIPSGVNVTWIRQLAPDVIGVPQLFVWAKSPLLVPEIAMFVILIVDWPPLVNSTPRGPELVVPTV
jgi:hypothetical protein